MEPETHNNNSVFALRTETETLYFDHWNEALHNGLFEVGCIDEIFLDEHNEQTILYKTGNIDYSLGEI
jgi:hypothetical protein